VGNLGQPQYGQQPPYGQQPFPGSIGARPNHKDAVPSLVLGILSLVLCGFFTGIPAIVLGRRARREIAASNGTLDGEGMATAGFVLGLISTVVAGLAFLLVVAVFIFGGVIKSAFDETCTPVGNGGQHQTSGSC
jgi:Domain of unknown function (DUF4190)